MKYNTKDVYFGCVTFNVSKGDFWRGNTEAFLKNGDKYLSIKSKTRLELYEYEANTEKYLTVSELYPIVNMMKDKQEIPETISDRLINLYLVKHRFNKQKEMKNKTIFSNQPKTK